MIFGIIGVVLILVGWIWTTVTAFKIGGTLWGVLNILFFVQPLVGIVSAAMKKAEWIPVGLMILGVVFSSLGVDYLGFQP